MFLKIFKALSKRERLALIFTTVVLVFTGALRFSFYILDHTTISAAKGGEYREGIVGQPVFINPVIPTTEADRDMSRLIFGNLYEIADSVKSSADGKAWIVHIKEGWKWHDNMPVTSDDVIFTLKTIQDKDAHSYLYTSFQGIAAERVSELEIKFTLQAPYVFFKDEHLKKMYIIPKHIFGQSEIPNLRFSKYGLNPVGFGPYRVESFTHDDKGVIETFRLTVNENFGGAGDERKTANIASFIFKFYASEEALVDAYNAGAIDGFMLSSSEMLAADPELLNVRHEIHDLKSSRYYAVFINQALGSKELKSQKVREALSRSVDRETLVRNIFAGRATPTYGPTTLTINTPGTYDPALLKDLTINLIVPDEEFLVKTAEELKSQWSAAGAAVTVMPMSLKDIQEKTLRNADYEMLLFGNNIGASNDLFTFWHSSRRFYPDLNLSLFQDKKVDGLIESYRKNFDETARAAALKTISDLIASQYPAIFLYSPDYIYVSTPNLNGFNDTKTINNISSDRFSDIENWYVKTRRVWIKN